MLREKSEKWSFNYWTRRAGERHDAAESSYPAYPDDLDDTFAALVALARHDVAIIDGHAIAAIAKMLTAREVDIGGPYRTWLVADAAAAKWQDVDLVVNSTIGYFLSLIGVQLPRLKYFMDDAIRTNQLSSPYYPGIFHVGYFLSRCYENYDDDNKADVRDIVANIIVTRLRNDYAQNMTSLEYAMAISSLVNLGHTEWIDPAMVDTFADRIVQEGFLPYAFCIDPAREGKRCYAGASALTAAFCAQALNKYSACNVFSIKEIGVLAETPTDDDHIRALARALCHTLRPDLHTIALASLEKTTDKKITALAYEFREILYRKGMIIPLEIIEQLSLANLYGWIAYDIYDDALDGDGEYASSLPCANLFLRALSKIYVGLDARIAGAQALFDRTMNLVDNANVWEQQYCRITIRDEAPRPLPQFDDYQTLADRSIGHAMGPLAELLYAGYAIDSEEYINVEQFFRHYLIARQLHDDAHDWAEDLMNGRINSVGAYILQNFREKNIHKHSTQKIIEVISNLKKIFWEKVIDDTVILIQSHIIAARCARECSHVLADTDFMESTLRALEAAAHRAIKERDKTLVFLEDYKMK